MGSRNGFLICTNLELSFLDAFGNDCERVEVEVLFLKVVQMTHTFVITLLNHLGKGVPSVCQTNAGKVDPDPPFVIIVEFLLGLFVRERNAVDYFEDGVWGSFFEEKLSRRALLFSIFFDLEIVEAWSLLQRRIGADENPFEVREKLLAIQRNVYVDFLVFVEETGLVSVDFELLELLHNAHVFQEVIGLANRSLSQLGGGNYFLGCENGRVGGIVSIEEGVSNKAHFLSPRGLLVLTFLQLLFGHSKGYVLHHFSQNVGMSESGSQLAFELAELFEESADLEVQLEDVFVCWVEVHFEEGEGLVVFVHWIIALFFESLPKFEEVEFTGLVVQDDERLYLGNHLLQVEVLF